VRANLEETRHRNYELSWADATTTFLQSGSDWPGGEKNKHILGLKIQELGLMDAEDKTAAIAAAYASMKSDGLVFSNDGSTEGAARRSTRQAAPDLDRATPQELLESWKSAQPSIEAANSSFSALFGRK